MTAMRFFMFDSESMRDRLEFLSDWEGEKRG